MYRGHRVGVVVPVYNEAAFVGDVIDGLPAYVDAVYPIDDCSTDGSWAVILERAVRAGADGFAHERAPDTVGDPPRDDPVPDPVPAARLGGPVEGDERTPTSDGGTDTGPRVVPIRHDTNRGRGGAVKTGYRAALEDGLDVVAVLDGDGQMDPTELHLLLDPIVSGTADYAKGNRLSDPDDRGEMSGWRLFGNAPLTLLTRVASGYWGMSDPQNGYTAVSRDALRDLSFDRIYEDYGFLNDVLVQLNVAGARVADVQMRARYGEEESGIQYRSFVPRLSWLLARRFVWRLRVAGTSSPRPVAPLYGLAALAAVGGVGGSFLSLGGGTGHAVPVALTALAGTVVLTAFAVAVDAHNNSPLVSRPDVDRSPE
jgi:glycosyltransferase involved in cell wall biosynthesis